MSDANIAQQVRTFIVTNYLLGREEGLKDGDSFLDGGIIDSTGVLELVSYLQDTFGIHVEDDELVFENLDSISSVTAYVSRKLNAGAAASAVQGSAAGGQA